VRTGTVPPVVDRPVVFARDYELWAMSADGSNAHVLYDPPGIVADPEWSPDGTRVAFGVDETVWVLAVEGPNAGTARSVGPGRQPTWSADGRTIAFADYDAAGNSDIWLVGADGTNRRRLTLSPQWEAEPAWSPDGRAIAYVNAGADFYGGTASVGAPSAPVIHVVAPDGTGDRVVVDNGREPAWSGDGTRLAFARQGGGLGVARADGADVRSLTDGAGGRDLSPAWSREGTIVFERDPDATLGQPDAAHPASLYAVRADGTGLRRLGSGTANDADPAVRRA
jgi:TolB protein